MTDTPTINATAGRSEMAPASAPEFLTDLLLEVRAGRALLASWPHSPQLREACACLATAAAAVQDAQSALAGVEL